MCNDGRRIALEETAESVEMQLQREQFDRNLAWLRVHASEVYSTHRGKCICVAGQELFVADTAKEVVAQALAAHPDDLGHFVHYIPKERVPRVYEDQRRMV
jgi:hypothetical protein